jgi:sigma-E factor negative regulatory protein RseB
MLMKHLVLARLFAIATLGVTLVTSLSVQASADDDVWQVLQKAAVAAHALSYQGIFYYQAGSQSKPVQITHLFNGKGEFARNVVLDNAPREVFSQGNDLVIFNPRNEKIVIEKRHGQNMFPAILPTNLDSVKESYSLRAGERERVAGRPAQMLFLESKDTLRYGYRFWIDTEYGLLLKSEMLNGHNEVIESIAFNQLGLMDILDLDWFQPKIDNKKSYVMENETATIAYNSVSTDWKLKDLPLGFRKVDQMIRMVHGKTLPVTQVVLSDGLASVSLFIEPITKNIKPRIGHKLVGGTSFFASVSDGYQLTVVGEVPEVTVAQIANAVVFKK